MIRNSAQAIVVWLILSTGFIAPLAIPRRAEAQTQTRPRIATLVVYRAEVAVNGQSGANETPIYSGDTITTGPTGRAAVNFFRGGSIELDANTSEQAYDRSDPGFSGRLGAYFVCLTHIVFGSGQSFWKGEGQGTCFTHGQVTLAAYSQFNLQLSSGRDVLTVAEGQVSVGGTQPQSLTVPAGVQVSIADGRIIDQRQVSPEELRRITAWRWRSTFRPYYPFIPPSIPRPAPPPSRPQVAPVHPPVHGR